ncbi:hypothetical protein BLL52_4294 [Rhodoferax antarcticus ANT.BR]|uniref:Uncharacterized protein n=1 Tax=Rhodoferax antarcticus ANT.BR TaxID=1111071 RepID=A0A1Q8Y942_9BURK|nr:hypothetical protein BLL52_4294 [Rhodoferax antarcticus ANT.BR]
MAVLAWSCTVGVCFAFVAARMKAPNAEMTAASAVDCPVIGLKGD